MFKRNKLHYIINSSNNSDFIQFNTNEQIIKLLNIVLQYNTSNYSQIIIQKCFNTDNFGILFVSNDNNIHDLKYLYEQLKQFSVFGYMLNDDIYYLSKNKVLVDIFDNSEYSYSIGSFTQTNKYSCDIIHDFINNNIIKNNCNFLGIGGEMRYYAHHNKQFLNNIQLCTDNKYIYTDCDHFKCDLVDYKILDIGTYYLDNTILLINISKKGLGHLAKQINNMMFEQILYIGCSQKYVEKDIQNLNNYIIVSNNYFNIDDNGVDKRFIINFKYK